MTPRIYYEEPDIQLWHGDCREILPRLPEVDLVLTDPPYGLSGKHDEDSIIVEGHAPFVRRFGGWDNEWNPSELLTQANHLLKEGGGFLAFMAHEWIHLFSIGPLTQKKLGVWIKPNPAPRVRPGYQHATEFWMWKVKDGAKPTWNGGFTQTNAISHAVCAGYERTCHPTQKPVSLMAGFVKRHSNVGDLILDPFAGSGTTLVAAKQLGRCAIGIEIEEKYCAIAARRIRETTPPLPNFHADEATGKDVTTLWDEKGEPNLTKLGENP